MSDRLIRWTRAHRGGPMAALSAFAIGLAALPSHGAIVRVDFLGEVHSVTGAAVGIAAVGDPVSGTLIYDDAGGSDSDSSPNHGRYLDPPIIRLDALVGDYSVTGDPLAWNAQISVYDDQPSPPSDSFIFRTGFAEDPVGGELSLRSLQFGMSFVGDTSAIDSDAIPGLADLIRLQSELPQRTLNFLTFGERASDRVDWTITSYTATPEPGSGVLTLVGLATMAARRRCART